MSRPEELSQDEIFNYLTEMGSLNGRDMRRRLVHIVGSSTLRAQARLLRGTDAVALSDCIHEVGHPPGSLQPVC